MSLKKGIFFLAVCVFFLQMLTSGSVFFLVLRHGVWRHATGNSLPPPPSIFRIEHLMETKMPWGVSWIMSVLFPSLCHVVFQVLNDTHFWKCYPVHSFSCICCQHDLMLTVKFSLEVQIINIPRVLKKAWQSISENPSSSSIISSTNSQTKRTNCL